MLILSRKFLSTGGIINKFGIKKFLPYFLIGLFLWYFTHESGIHSTISGVLLAATIPHRNHEKDYSLLLKLEHLPNRIRYFNSKNP